MKKPLMIGLFLAAATLLFAGIPAVKHTVNVPVQTKTGGMFMQQVAEPATDPLPHAGTRDPRTLDDVIISENFDAVPVDSLPTGWIQVDVDQGSTTNPSCPGLSVWKVYQQAGLPPHSGTRIVANHYNDNALPNNDWLILPQENLTGTITFSFWAASQDPQYLESFEVKVSTTGTQPANFTNLIASVTSVPNAWTHYSYDLSAFAGAPMYIAIHYNSTDMFILKVDDVLLEAGSPGAIRGLVTDLGTSQPLAGASVMVSGGPSDTTDATGHYVIGAVSEGTHVVSFSHDGYNTQVDSNVTVTAGDTLTLNAALTPRTTHVVFTQDFEGIAVDSLPVGWSQVDVDHGSTTNPSCPGLSVWKVYSAAGLPAHSGTHIVANHYNDNALPNDDWLILPQQTLAAPINITFWAASQDPQYLESFEVKVSTAGTQPADFSHLIASVTSVPNAWTEYSYDLSTYAGTPFYISIHYNATDMFILKVDDVTLEAGAQSVSDGRPSLANSFVFEGNYPNPFNSQTEFRFSIPRTAPVELALFNIAGQQVTKLVSGTLNPGEHTVWFDASHLTSGIYFARLSSSGMTATRKMMLLK